MDPRIRDLYALVKKMCPEGTAHNVRFNVPVPRRSYMMFRVEGADALDVGCLAIRHRDCLFFMRNLPTGAALDIYVPTGKRPAIVMALRFMTSAALSGAAAAAVLAVWTMSASRF